MIFLDHAATTPLNSQVLEAMQPYFSDDFGNASSLHQYGQHARQALDEARLTISDMLQCSLDELIFTSGATESNNLFLQGVILHHCSKNPEKIPHVITSSIEHSSVLEVLKHYEKNNKISLTVLSVNEQGLVLVEALKDSITPETVLVSVQAVNNEIGTIQPISRIGRICQKQGIVFHVDAVQAAGYIPVSCEAWKCDGLSLSAHKIYGPKGVGLLFVRQGTELLPIAFGGGQERGYRSGTENVSGIVGFVEAMRLATDSLPKTVVHLQSLQHYTKQYFDTHLKSYLWNGAEIGESRSVANVNISFPFDISGESLVQRLDLAGVAVSLGSACSSGLMKPSHVITAIGRSEAQAKSSLRITFGRATTMQELETALEIIVKTIKDMRKLA